MQKIFVWISLISSLPFSNNSFAETKIKDGFWEITVKIDIEEGMPMQMPAQTIRQFIKKDNPVPKLEEPDKNYNFTSEQMTGNTVSWKVE